MNAAVQPDVRGPVARLFDGRRLLAVEAADLMESTLTLRMDQDMPVPRGMHCLVSESEALAMLAEERRWVRLQPPQGEVVVSWFGLRDLGFEVEAPGFQATLYYRRGPETHGRLPGRFWGSISMKDQLGREWSRSLPEMVTDDFGSLVPVDGGVL